MAFALKLGNPLRCKFKTQYFIHIKGILIRIRIFKEIKFANKGACRRNAKSVNSVIKLIIFRIYDNSDNNIFAKLATKNYLVINY